MNARRPHESSSASLSYWMYGHHACAAALRNPRRVTLRIVTTGRAAEALPEARRRRPTVETLDARALDRLVGAGAAHQGVALQVKPLEEMALEELLNEDVARPRILLVLDQVTDPHNFGAILRSAAAFGVAGVVAPRDNSPKESGALAKAASGALDIVPLARVTNLARTLGEMKESGYWVVGLDGAAQETIGAARSTGKIALALGAEGKGLRPLTARHCDLLARIPTAPRMESLNVSNAAAVALYALAAPPQAR